MPHTISFLNERTKSLYRHKSTTEFPPLKITVLYFTVNWFLGPYRTGVGYFYDGEKIRFTYLLRAASSLVSRRTLST